MVLKCLIVGTYMNRIAVADQVNGVCKLSEPDNFLESKNCLRGNHLSR